jgi:HlyD family secretion protein
MKSQKFKLFTILIAIQLLALICISLKKPPQLSNENETILTSPVHKRSYPIEIRSVGELEASRSTSVACALRLDQPKIIDLTADGIYVTKGDLLVRIDPSPYEKKLEDLQSALIECENQIEISAHALDWEKDQAEHELKTAQFEMESAHLELNKIINGDGPLEIGKLKSTMQKSMIKYEDLNRYSDDLIALEAEGFLDPIEVRQTQKKLEEEIQAYETAKKQYESYISHVLPMQIKKAETQVKRLGNKQEETIRTGKFKVSKAESALTLAKQRLIDLHRQVKETEYELHMTEIRAPGPGMVVLREEYRQSQKRKPRVGDVIVRNQPILDLPDLSSMLVKTKVREVDLYKIEIGKAVTIEVDAYPNLLFHGDVTFIGILAISDIFKSGDEKYFEVKVAMNETDPRLRPGMTARLVIHAGEVKNALTVPIHSVFESAKKNYCYIVQNNSYVKQLVETGMNNEHWVEIKSGLKENQHVCLSLPPETLVIKGKPLEDKASVTVSTSKNTPQYAIKQ